MIVCKAHIKRLRRVNVMNLLNCIKINNALIIEYVIIKTFMFNHVSGVFDNEWMDDWMHGWLNVCVVGL